MIGINGRLKDHSDFNTLRLYVGEPLLVQPLKIHGYRGPRSMWELQGREQAVLPKVARLVLALPAGLNVLNDLSPHGGPPEVSSLWLKRFHLLGMTE